MWQGFIGHSIAATNRTLRHLGIVLLAAAFVLCLFAARTFFNFQRGPAYFDEQHLAAIKDPRFQWRDYVMVEGRDAVSTGITSVETRTRNGVVESETTTGEYVALFVGKHILLVRARPGQPSQKYTGAIVSLPEDVKQRVFSDMADPDLQTATLPVLLDATAGYGESLFLAYAVIGGLVVGGLWSTSLSKRRADMPERHPLCKALAQYGPLYSVVPEIDSDAASWASTVSGTTFTRNWIIVCRLGKSEAIRRDEIVWVYKKRTKHSVNFIPTGSTYCLVVRDTRGKLLEISDSEQNVNRYLEEMARALPWVVFGHDQKLEKLYRKQRDQFVGAVSERKAAMQSGKA